jgi:hypothetical protein
MTWGFTPGRPSVCATSEEAFIFCEHPKFKERDKMLTICKLRFC